MKTLFLKNTILLISLVICFRALSAQDVTKNEKKLPTFNIFNNSDYTIAGVAIGDFELKFTMKNKGESKPEYIFSVNNFNIKTFENGFKKGVNDQEMDSSNTNIKKEAATLFYYYIAGVNAINQNLDFNIPVAGVLTVVDTSTRIRISKEIDKELKRKVRWDIIEIRKDAENSHEKDSLLKGFKSSNDLQNKTFASCRILGRNPNSHRINFPARARYYYKDTQNSSTSRWYKKREFKKLLYLDKMEKEDKQEELIINKLSTKYDSIVTKYEEETDSLNYYNANFSVSDSLLKEKGNYIEEYDKRLDKEQWVQNDYFSEQLGLEQLLKEFGLVGYDKFITKYKLDSTQLKFYTTRIKSQIKDQVNKSLKTDTVLLTTTEGKLGIIEVDTGQLNSIDSVNTQSARDSIFNKINDDDINKNALVIQIDSLKKRIALLQWLVDKDDVIGKTEAKISFYTAKIRIADNSLKKLKTDVVKIRKNVGISTEKVNKENQALYIAALNYYTGLLKLRQPYFKITETEIELRGGYMENVRVKGKISIIKLKGGPDNVKLDELVFENIMPIGFSREVDYDAMNKVKLMAIHPISREKYYLILGDVMNYDLKHAVNRRDYSPKNQMITFNDNKTEKTLKKQDSYKLFEIKVYSDFVGMNETAPNGLIQSELEKEIPILTRRYPAIKAWRSNWSYLEQIVPKLILSKLEDKNKYLPIRYYDLMNGNEYTPEKYVSTLELYQYESFSTGMDINILVFDIINAKSTIRLDGGFRYGTTPVVDSTRVYDGNNISFTNEFQHHNITTFRFFPRISLSIYPEERFSIKMSFTHSWYYARTNLFAQVGSVMEFELDNDKEQPYTHQFNTVELKAAINMQNASSGKLFFRYIFNWQQNYWNTGFSQIQVGYAFYLMGKYKQ